MEEFKETAKKLAKMSIRTVTTLFLPIIVIILICFIAIKYYNYKINYNNVVNLNSEYEQYLDKEIAGIELATLINKTIDKNRKNNIEQNENDEFIQNDSNSIKIEIYIKDNETTYKMEVFYNSGTEQFIQYYGNIKFKCSKIEYHEKTGKIKYILFEQIQTS